MLDTLDLKLLSALQTNAHLSAQELSQELNLSASQIGRSRQRLEADGYIEADGARLSPKRLCLAVHAFVQVHLAQHGPDHSKSFARLVNLRSEITSVWTMTGEADYLLRVYCSDLSELNTLLHEILLPHPAVGRVQSQIVMDQLKRDGPLPT